jgi:hypothetical protein
MTITLNGTTGITTPAVTNEGAYTGDGVVFADSTPSNTLVTTTGGNVGVGTASPSVKLDVTGSGVPLLLNSSNNQYVMQLSYASNTSKAYLGTFSNALIFAPSSGSEAARIDSSGNLLVGSTTYTGDSSSGAGGGFGSPTAVGVCWASVPDSSAAIFNRQTNDGTVVLIRQAGTTEGTISVSGTTVSYNGGHLARFAQTLTAKNDSLLKGTVLSNLDEMNTYVDADGNVAENEQLNKVKVSDVEGDVNVAGVFVNWSFDEQHNVDEINMAMTGDMIIRIAEDITVQRGDLLMSAGDGTAKPQGDDIVRSKTIAKVTSTNITCTYADGSYCVPCVLMAC